MTILTGLKRFGAGMIVISSLAFAGHSAVAQELHKVFPRNGPGVIVTLDLIAVLVAQKFQLPLGFHTLCNNTHIETLSHADYRGCNRLRPGAMPWIISARSISAIVGLPGMPSDRVGTSAPAVTPLLAASDAITPSGSPVPNASRFGEERFASA